MTKQAKYIAFSVLIAASVALWWRPLVSDVQLASSNDAYTYILLIIPLSLSLIYLERQNSANISPQTEPWGGVLLAAALLTRAVIVGNIWHLSPSDNLSLSIAMLVVFWIGSAISCFGVNALKRSAFPLCFLFLLVPMPDHILSWVTQWLQQQSAWSASLLFRVVGVPVTRDGIMLSVPGLDIEVARECSSIRSSTMLIVVTLILAQLFLRTWSRKLLLVLAAIPLAFVKNAVRIVTIAELATRIDRGFLDGRLHHNGGILFLGLAIVAVIALLWILRKSEIHHVPSNTGSPHAAGALR